MAYEVVMPRLGWSMEEGILVEWLLPHGATVRAGEVVCVIESDKAQNEVEAFEGGTLHIPADAPPPGTKVPVGTLLGHVLRAGEAPPPARGPRPEPVQSGGAGSSVPLATSAPAAEAFSTTAAVATPRARRVAVELGVDWTRVTGSGRDGRVRERDIRGARRPAARAGRRPTSVRRLVAERMTASARAVAPVTLTTDADATELVRYRQENRSDAGGPVPSYNDLLVKVVAVALGEHPALNASLDGDAIVEHEAVHVGLAVDAERGLVVAVLRDVHRKTLAEIARESAPLIAGARAGTLSPDALRGGTFTISNLGPYEIDAFTPIINLPECAILGVGRILARPVVVDEASGRIEARRMTTLSLTFDHRLVDGGPAARFLQRVKQLIERPYLWLGR